MRGIFDVHSHLIIPEYMESLKQHGRAMEDGFPSPMWCVKDHLDYMAMAGIEKCLLSMSSPHFHSGDAKEAVSIGRYFDEAASALKKKYPDKFLFAASLPVPEIDEAIAAMNYAYDVLSADAVKLPSNALGIYPGDISMDALFAAMNERNAVLLLHPTAPATVPGGCFTAGPLPLMEFIGDTTRAVINLITTGTLEKYQNIKVIVPHCGSFLPNIIDRLTGITKVLAAKGIGQPVDVSKSMKSLYFDVAGDCLPAGIDILMTMTDEDHIMFGGDFPYTPKEMIANKVKALENSEKIRPYRDKLMYENAAGLFGAK